MSWHQGDVLCRILQIAWKTELESQKKTSVLLSFLFLNAFLWNNWILSRSYGVHQYESLPSDDLNTETRPDMEEQKKKRFVIWTFKLHKCLYSVNAYSKKPLCDWLQDCFQITDLVAFKRLHLEKTMNNSSYYIITEYLKPWESSKSYFSSVSTYSRMRFRAYFLNPHLKNQRSHSFWLGSLPLRWCAPVSTDPPSDAQLAWRGGSCSDSGGQTLSPASLEEHTGHRLLTPETGLKRWMTPSSWDKWCIWQIF